MAKPDPALLDPARYPFHYVMATRFGDLDPNMHLNNVALAGVLEDSRVRFNTASGFRGAIAEGATNKMTAMIASFTVEYMGQAYYPQSLDTYAAMTRIGRTSFVIQQLIVQESRVVICAQSVMVCIAHDQPTPLPATFIDAVTSWMLRP